VRNIPLIFDPLIPYLVDPFLNIYVLMDTMNPDADIFIPNTRPEIQKDLRSVTLTFEEQERPVFGTSHQQYLVEQSA